MNHERGVHRNEVAKEIRKNAPKEENIIYYIITMTSIPVMKVVSRSMVIEETPHTYARTLTLCITFCEGNNEIIFGTVCHGDHSRCL